MLSICFKISGVQVTPLRTFLTRTARSMRAREPTMTEPTGQPRPWQHHITTISLVLGVDSYALDLAQADGGGVAVLQQSRHAHTLTGSSVPQPCSF